MRRQTDLTTMSSSLHVVQSDGTGLPIVMLHGTASSHAAFDRQMDSPLARRHRLIALDLPGHGASSDATNAESYSLRAMTQAVTEAVAQLQLERFMILGWSLGGHIALEMIDHPGLVGLMLCGAPPVARGPLPLLRAFKTTWDIRLASKEQFSDSDVARFFSLCFARGASPELLEAVRRADGRVRPAIVRSLLRGECSDQRRAVETAAVPVALVNGRDDPLLRLGYLDTLAGPSLWHGVPLVLEEAGHAPFWDQPEIFNELLETFAGDAEVVADETMFRYRQSA